MEIPESLKMPKPLERYTKEELNLSFFKRRIIGVSQLIQGRREVKLTLCLILWQQIGRPLTINELKNIVHHFGDDYTEPLLLYDIKESLEKLFNEKINYNYLPHDLLEYYDRQFMPISEPQTAEFISIKPEIAKLIIQIALYLKNPLDAPWKFIEDIFIIPKPLDSLESKIKLNFDFSDLSEALLLLISLFEFFSTKFSGIQEHFLKIAATLFWLTRLEPAYSLEIYELLTEMIGEHKLDTRSSQLYDAGHEGNELIIAEKKGKNKNRAIIYFGLKSGAEWIISAFFPDQRLVIQQQAIAISFLRYSQQLLIQPWKINPMAFNYLMDIWFRSFLYSDNLDQMVYEKAKEHRRRLKSNNE